MGVSEGLGELARLSGELKDENQGELDREDLVRLHDFEIVKKLLKEAEEAKTAGDEERARRLYDDLSGRYAALSPEYKRGVAERCIRLHQWLKNIQE